ARAKALLVVGVKGTFDLVPGHAARLAEEQELPLGERTFDGSDTPRHPNDLVPFKPRADVFLLGHAYAHRSSPVTRVGLRLGRALDFALAAMGERRWSRG